MAKKDPIALFDSGVGGLTIAKEVIAEFPKEQIIYFGDTAHLPYGIRPQNQVRDFVLEIIDYFTKINAKMVIIACNTATAAGLKEAQKQFALPIIGPIEPGVEEAVLATANKKIGVIATEGTIESGAYQKGLKKASSKVEVFSQPCPEFIPLVERGELYSSKAKGITKAYLRPLKKEGIDTLLLGCTHFPYLEGIIREVMGKEVKLIYPGRGIALRVREILKQQDLLNEDTSIKDNQFYVSDLDKLSNDFVKLGKDFLNFKELEFKKLDIWR
ncbi:glutamate racemase [Orenia metallireducens]|uniref:Glutamate racemase n=1 Tax=Orenia metallireducens TaxID=1413210 RepID=A0A285H6K8_9FIRM|nr:glutamate racemase [Orenia metallireducens]PRX17803.1 glutamate racemase [Orenia metallireducens]SNY31153.1 glutamate racemase [Orenia metallireducens]